MCRGFGCWGRTDELARLLLRVDWALSGKAEGGG
jgi:hypothetical protein